VNNETPGVIVSELPAPFPHEQAVEAYGVRLALGASDQELFAHVAAVLPPLARPCDPSTVGARFGLVRDKEVGYRIVGNSVVDVSSLDLEIATGLLDELVRRHVAHKAPDRIFVHAGVVAWEGRALMLPGHSMSGKTTLVAELLRAGATYYSDEYAVLDADGLVHPDPRPLSFRTAGADNPIPAESLGSVASTEPVRARLIAVARYAPGAKWRPSRLSRAQAVLTVLSHTLAARERPQDALAAVTRLAAEATVLAGDRGEATDVVPTLLSALKENLADDPRENIRLPDGR
jgi:hypothetical protein